MFKDLVFQILCLVRNNLDFGFTFLKGIFNSFLTNQLKKLEKLVAF